MASLLSKFRIDYSALKVIADVSKPAQQRTRDFFDSLIADFQGSSQSNGTTDEGAPYQPFLFLKSKVSIDIRLSISIHCSISRRDYNRVGATRDERENKQASSTARTAYREFDGREFGRDVSRQLLTPNAKRIEVVFH